MMKKNIILSVIISLTLVLSAQAQTSASPSVEELQKQIQQLLSQMSSLQKEVTTLKSATPAPTSSATSPASTIPPTTITAPVPSVQSAEIDESQISETETTYIPPPILTRSLFRGSRGDDVRQLQEFLAQDSNIYPEGSVSGYYGAGTEAAIKRWQAKNGVPSVGIVGRQTIAKFKEIYSGGFKQPSDRTDISRPVPPTSCPVYAYMPACKEGQSSYEKGCQVCQIKQQETTKKEVCPASPTVDSCLAGEERVVTYKSEACGVYYTCKPRTLNRAENTLATLKKVSAIQTDNRYNLVLNDPEGIQKFSVYNSKGAEIHSGFPACRTDWTSPTIGAENSEFPLKLTLTDCGNPNSFFSTALSTPVVVKPTAEGLSFPYKFSNGKIVYSSEEGRSYCYTNGPGTGQGVAGECETKFGVVYTAVTTTTASANKAIYLTDVFAACMTRYGFGAEAKQIKTWAQASEAIPWSTLSGSAQTTTQKCESEYYGQQNVETGTAMCADGKDNDGDGFIDVADPSCAGYTTTTTTATTQNQTLTQNTTTNNSNWVQKTWNFRDGQSTTSSILNRTDAEYANYLAPIQAQCLTINKSQFAWKPNAGSDAASNWQNFGIPDCSGTATTGNVATGDSCSKYGSGWHSMSAGLCFDSAMQNYRTTNDTLYSCSATPATGCTTTTSPAGQKEQVWNSLGLRSWIRTDADTARIDQLKSACANTPTGANIWLPNAGTSSSVDFGMPSADKCRVAATCTTSQYFDGANCVSSSSTNYYSSSASTYAGDANSCPGFAYSRWDYSSPSRRYCQLNTEARCDYNYPSYLTNGANYTAANCPAPTSGSNSSTWCSPLGSDWTVYGSYCLNSSRTQYTSVSSPNSSSIQACTGTDSPVTGCTPPGGSTTTTTSTGSCSQYGSGWHVMGDSNCYDSNMTSYRTANGTLYSCSSTPSSGCSGSSTTSSSSASCGSGYYWNGSSCVSSSSTTGSSCTSGQYWNGTACVSSTPSASVYDQMRDQLKSMEIILRGLLGR